MTDTTTATKLMQAFMQMRHIFRGLAQFRTVEGCTASESMMLYVIRRSQNRYPNGIKASELGSWLHITSPSVTQALNVLEAKGLLERGSDPDDRRVVRIRLSEAGRQAMSMAEEHMLGSMNELAQHLGEESTLQFVEVMERIHAYYLEQFDANSTPVECPNQKED